MAIYDLMKIKVQLDDGKIINVYIHRIFTKNPEKLNEQIKNQLELTQNYFGKFKIIY